MNEVFEQWVTSQKVFRARKQQFYVLHAHSLRPSKESLKDLLRLIVTDAVAGDAMNAQTLTQELRYALFEWLQNMLQEAFQELVREGDIIVDARDYCRRAPDPAPPLTTGERFAILKRDNYRCRICGVAQSDGENVRLHVDHITPRSKRGTNDSMNLWVLCADCNRGKGTQEL